LIALIARAVKGLSCAGQGSAGPRRESLELVAGARTKDGLAPFGVTSPSEAEPPGGG
jgi:hypothetical protein